MEEILSNDDHMDNNSGMEEMLTSEVPDELSTEFPNEATPVFQCTLCSYETVHIGVFNKHKKAHRQCKYCGKTFSPQFGHGIRDYKNHMKKHQPKPAKEKIIHECDKCPKTFPFKSYLDRHKKTSDCYKLFRHLLPDQPVQNKIDLGFDKCKIDLDFDKLEEIQDASAGTEEIGEAEEAPDEVEEEEIEEEKQHGQRSRTKAKKFDEEIYDLEEYSEDGDDPSQKSGRTSR